MGNGSAARSTNGNTLFLNHFLFKKNSNLMTASLIINLYIDFEWRFLFNFKLTEISLIKYNFEC